MKHNFRTQLPPVVWQAMILEQESAPYLLSTHLTEPEAFDRLAAEQRKFNPNCKEECWLYVETVRNGNVVARTDLNPTETGSLASA